MLKKLKNSISGYISTADKKIAAHPKLYIVGTFLFAIILTISRRPETVFKAQFWAEDGVIWYSQAYNQGAVHTLFQTYAGYFALIHRFVASICVFVPLHIVPLIFNLVSVLFFVLPFMIITSKRFNTIIHSRLIALGVGLLYLGTLNIAEIYGNLANIQWPLALALVLVLIYRPAKSIWGKFFDAAVIIASGISGPSVILLTPLAFYLYFVKKQKHQKLNIICLVATSLLQLSGIFIISHFQRLGTQSDANFVEFTKIVVGQIFVGGLLGANYSNYLFKYPVALYAALVAGGALMLYAFIRGPLWLKVLQVYALLMLLSALASLRTNPGDIVSPWTALTYPGGGQRYWLVPIITWIASLLWLTVKAPNKIFASVSTILITGFIVFGLPLGWRIKPLEDLHFQTYARQFEHSHTGEKTTITENPGWQLVLIKR